MTDYPRALRYAKHLIFVDFAVAFLGALAGIEFYFWHATLQCGVH